MMRLKNTQKVTLMSFRSFLQKIKLQPKRIEIVKQLRRLFH